MMPVVFVILALVLTGCQPSGPPGDSGGAGAGRFAGVFDGTGGTWVDLTHAFSDSTIYWPTDTLGFVHEKLAYGKTDGGWFYSSFRYSAAEHGGTHLDAPIHFGEGRRTSDALPLSSLIGPAVVVDVSARATPDYLVSVEDLTRWEGEHGRIPDGAIVLARTGWDKRYGDRAAYLGTALRGPEAVPQLHFPGLSPAAAQWLVDERKIAAFGLDTPSLDYGQSKDFRAHVILAAKDVPGFENVANLDQLPPAGSFVVALPMKIAGGSGGPLRIVAFVPQSVRAGEVSSQTTTRESTMSWWQRLWHRPSSPPPAEGLGSVKLAMDGWREDAPSGDMRTWRSSQGDVLSLAAPEGSLGLPAPGDVVGIQQWCRTLAESRGAGLIEVHVGDGDPGGTVSMIYKRLEGHAYVFTGMWLISGDEVSRVWTIVSGERGTTGVREAIVTGELMNAGRLTIEDYERSWARDPYDANYDGVDRSVLRFVSDDERYDEQFPEHPLSKVRRVLATLPAAVQVD